MTPQDPKTRAKELAAAHWHGYVQPTLAVHARGQQLAYTAAEVMEIAEHHYLTAAYHFYMHAAEDCANGIFRKRIGEPLTAAEVDDITASIPSGCQNGECAHHAPTFSCNCRLYGMAGPEHCGFYIDPDAGTVKPDRPDNCAHFDPEVCNCHTCHNCDGYERETGETIAPPSATIEEVCGILADRAAGEVGPMIFCGDCAYTLCPCCGEKNTVNHCDSYRPKHKEATP